MKMIHIFWFEQKHFRRSPSKVFSFTLFLLACVYSIYNGFELQQTQQSTIQTIIQEQEKDLDKTRTWFSEGKNGPEDRAWVDIHEPYWALRYTPTYTIKRASALLPLGIGQTEQYGYYKEIDFWSSTYDNDMVEEIANPERLLQGSIDFSFLVIYLLPLLLIILTYNIGGLERDKHFDKLVIIQSGSIRKWTCIRFAFYVSIMLITVVSLILVVAYVNHDLALSIDTLCKLILLATGYILFFSAIYFMVLWKGSGSRTIAFNMITIWLSLCVIIPGFVHQIASLQSPAHYMTDFLDTNRKEAYATYSLPSDSLMEHLQEIYPDIVHTKHGKESKKEVKIIRRSIGAIINEMNKNTVVKIERRNEIKNQIVRSSYLFNPVSFVQNQWNIYTSSDYYSFQEYRRDVQKAIDNKHKLLVFETWNQVKLDKESYEVYLKTLR